MRLPRLLPFLLLLATACGETPKQFPKLSETIPNLPIPPGGQVVRTEGGTDALSIRYRTALAPEAAANYYRELLGRDPWRLVSDTRSPDGVVSLYAEHDGPPLWVSIRKADGAEGSFVDLAGAKTR
jgi:hypothetical protein